MAAGRPRSLTNAFLNLSATQAGPIKQGAAVDDLEQDISASYTEAEIQAISDKIDELLAELRTAGVIASA